MTDEAATAADTSGLPRSPGFRRMFAPERLTLGVFFAIEAYSGDVPTMTDQIMLARRAEELGFAALWVRDVPLRDPSFGDVGQIYDPWVWLGSVTAETRNIALATGAIVLPLHRPLDVAKAAASVDNLSGGRLVLGVASGDRPVEFPAYGVEWAQRGVLFRESLAYIRRALEESFPAVESPLGTLHGADLIPKPLYQRIPVAVTGSSQQELDWIAANADAWVMYPRTPAVQARMIKAWREALARRAGGMFKPFAQSLYIDLTNDLDAPPQPIHLGFRLGRVALLDLLELLRQIGVNHVALNLKYGRRPASEVIEDLGEGVVPHFGAHQNLGGYSSALPSRSPVSA